MSIPMNCFTCGKPIAHLWETYQGLVAKYRSIIQNHPDQLAQILAPDPSKGLTAPTVAEGEMITPEFLALRELHMGRICCRRMFLGQMDMYPKIS